MELCGTEEYYILCTGYGHTQYSWKLIHSLLVLSEWRLSPAYLYLKSAEAVCCCWVVWWLNRLSSHEKGHRFDGCLSQLEPNTEPLCESLECKSQWRTETRSFCFSSIFQLQITDMLLELKHTTCMFLVTSSYQPIDQLLHMAVIESQSSLIKGLYGSRHYTSFCLKWNTGPEQFWAQIHFPRNPQAHLNQASPNKDQMCPFNAKQTSRWKRPASTSLPPLSACVQSDEKWLWRGLWHRSGGD